MFRVPNDEDAAAPWICFLQLANKDYPTFKKIKRIEICSKHFKEGDFRVGASDRRNVLKGRFPCLYKTVDLSNEVST